LGLGQLGGQDFDALPVGLAVGGGQGALSR
jgi:hypothetical protein